MTRDYQKYPDPKRQLAEIMRQHLPQDDPPKPKKKKKPSHERGVMNATEREYAELLEQRRLAGEIVAFAFEPVVLHLAPRLTYTPDFVVLLADGRYEFHEVKGAHVWEDSIVKVKVAAVMFAAGVVLAQKKRGKWTLKVIPHEAKVNRGGQAGHS